MARLTRKEERRLKVTGDLVRMYITVVTFVCAVVCVYYANRKYGLISQAGGVEEIPRAATYATITGIYLPMFAAAAAYVWATRAAPARSLAPRGYAMALFRDAFTPVVVTVLAVVPAVLYRRQGSIQDVHGFLAWYQTVLTAVAGGAFTYYFNAKLAPDPVTTDAPGSRSARAAAAQRARTEAEEEEDA